MRAGEKSIAVTNDRQALIPAGARLLKNPAGIAPGFYIDEDGPFLAVLPGVPHEMRAMFSEGLRPVLEERFGGKIFIRRRVLRTCGMSESAVNQAIQDILRRGAPVVGLTAKETGVDIRIIARAASAEQSQALVDRTEAAIREKLGDAVYGVDGEELEEVVGALLKQRRLTLAVAESCTGGLIGARITNIAGSSEYFERGVVVYSNLAKTEMLGVPADLIERHGAVSSEVAGGHGAGHPAGGAHGPGALGHRHRGTRRRNGKETRGTRVHSRSRRQQGVKTAEHRFLGDREQVRFRASQMALDMVRRYLIG